LISHQQASNGWKITRPADIRSKKLDFVLLPAFQFSGMEHAGAIFYNASSLLLEDTATQEQELARASTIAHETSHMWFGDLGHHEMVRRCVDERGVCQLHGRKDCESVVSKHRPRSALPAGHYPSAYAVDRTAGANPIRQKLDNLNEAGSLYGNIIYDKAPIVMRQLERMLGADGLRDGLREYLNRYAFGSATWTDLDQDTRRQNGRGPCRLESAWVDEPGRPTITTELRPMLAKSTALPLRSPTRAPLAGLEPTAADRHGIENGTRITPLK